MTTRVPAPAHDPLQRMIHAALPGGRVISVRRLRGGLAAAVHAIGVVRSDGTRTRVVLRRSRPDAPGCGSEQAVTEYRTLLTLNTAGVPAPHPLLLDANGRYFGGPAILMTYEGRPLVSPRNPVAWLRHLVDALASLETVTPARFDLTFLVTRGLDAMRDRAKRPLADAIAADPLAQDASAALAQRVSEIAWPDWCLVHGDFWPGNTVWRRERLGAIVDWSTAVVGDARIDLAQCRVDLAMMHGLEMADAFLASYEARRGTAVCDLWWFDLLIGLPALASFRGWLAGYHDIGLTHLHEHMLESRARGFLASALRRTAGECGGRGERSEPSPGRNAES